MRPVKFLPPARLEMAEAVRFLGARRSGLGGDFVAAIAAALREVRLHPQACPEVRPGIRKKLVRKFPYGIIYGDDLEEIVIIAVAHLHREPDYWLDRL